MGRCRYRDPCVPFLKINMLFFFCTGKDSIKLNIVEETDELRNFGRGELLEYFWSLDIVFTSGINTDPRLIL